MPTDYVTATGELVRKTERAALLDFSGVEVWVPFSVMSEDSQAEVAFGGPGDRFELEVAGWFAKKEGIEED